MQTSTPYEKSCLSLRMRMQALGPNCPVESLRQAREGRVIPPPFSPRDWAYEEGMPN